MARGVRSRTSFARAESLISALNVTGIEPVILKGGVNLFEPAFGDPGARMMRDLDCLVPPDRFEEAISVADVAGWWAQALLTMMSGSDGLRVLPAPRFSRDIGSDPRHCDTAGVTDFFGSTELVQPCFVASHTVAQRRARKAGDQAADNR